MPKNNEFFFKEKDILGNKISQGHWECTYYDGDIAVFGYSLKDKDNNRLHSGSLQISGDQVAEWDDDSFIVDTIADKLGLDIIDQEKAAPKKAAPKKAAPKKAAAKKAATKKR